MAHQYEQIIEGLKILQVTSKHKHDICAEHDVIWAGGDVKVNEEEKALLLELGWHFDFDVERWSHFV